MMELAWVRKTTCANLVLALFAAGCASHGDSDSAAYFGRSPAFDPGEPLQIEESDLYRVDGSWLYVQSARSGLNVIDVSTPRSPELIQNVPVRGRAGELYVDGDTAFVLLTEASPPCEFDEDLRGLIATTSQLVVVERATTAPEVAPPVCLPGHVVASRKIGDFIYVVTTYDLLDLTWASAIDVSQPGAPLVADSIVMEGTAAEVFVSDAAIYLAQEDGAAAPTTRVVYVSFDSALGTLRERGSYIVQGEPAGRFHMDAEGDTFRIVTRGQFWEGSNLHVIGFSDPDRPKLLGFLTGIAPNEDLHATRFEGDRAYVVTYEPVILQTDPLWVIALEDPQKPKILGHLEIPGWSDYVFPRGEQLVAVGRGDRGDQVAVALFDVADPTRPAELGRVAFGNESATSEANSDFRGATLIDIEQTRGLVVVPFTTSTWQETDCETEHRVQLVELSAQGLELRGASGAHDGAVRRTVPIGGELYAFGERQVSALDISNRDQPEVVANIDIGGAAVAASDEEAASCAAARWTRASLGNDVMPMDEGTPLACSASPGRGAGGTGALVLAGLMLGVGWLRRRH